MKSKSLFVGPALALGFFCATAFASCVGNWKEGEKSGIDGMLMEDMGEYYQIVDTDEELKSVVDIPSTFNGKPVTHVGESAFASCDGITKVTIPDSVTYIGDYAFMGCIGLTEIVIPDSVTVIDFGAFAGCVNLTNVTLGSAVECVGAAAFGDCPKLRYNEYDNALYLGNAQNQYLAVIKAKNTEITSCKINENTRVLGGRVFERCSVLNGITLPDGIKSIGAEAFYECAALSSVNIPNGVKSVGDYAFARCTGLAGIAIPKSVTEIGKSAFSGCSNLSDVSLSISVNSMGNDAFDGCNKITYYEYDNALYLGNAENNFVALMKAKNSEITSCEIADGTKIIGGYAFKDCQALTGVILPASVTDIGQGAFSQCYGITEISIPAMVTEIKFLAFERCTGLTAITLSDAVTKIGQQAFSYCRSLKEVSIGNGVKTVSEDAFEECPIEKATIPAIAAKSMRKSSLYIKADTMELSNYSLKTVVITSGTYIDDYAFHKCCYLAEVTLPDTIKAIGNYSFYECSALTEINIPATNTLIGDFAFCKCRMLTSINFTGTMKQWKGMKKSVSWSNTTGEYTIHCSDGDISKHMN